MRVAQELIREANIFLSQKKCSVAEACWMRALEIYKDVEIVDTSDLAIAFHGLACLCCLQRRYSEGEKFFINAIEIVTKTLDSKHLVANTVWNNFTLFLMKALNDNTVAELSSHPITQNVLRLISSAIPELGR